MTEKITQDDMNRLIDVFRTLKRWRDEQQLMLEEREEAGEETAQVH